MLCRRSYPNRGLGSLDVYWREFVLTFAFTHKGRIGGPPGSHGEARPRRDNPVGHPVISTAKVLCKTHE
jgi:hypothetical protein